MSLNLIRKTALHLVPGEAALPMTAPQRLVVHVNLREVAVAKVQVEGGDTITTVAIPGVVAAPMTRLYHHVAAAAELVARAVLEEGVGVGEEINQINSNPRNIHRPMVIEGE
jgi:hypothetical protein